MTVNNVIRTSTGISKNSANRLAERERLFGGLERFVNADDSSDGYVQLQATINSFWPVNIHSAHGQDCISVSPHHPSGNQVLGQTLAWNPAAQRLFSAYRDCLRRVWVGDFRSSEGRLLDGEFLNYLLGLNVLFTRLVPGEFVDATLRDNAFPDAWAELKDHYPRASCHSSAYIVPDWGRGTFAYFASNDFQAAVYALLLESWRAKVCRRCKGYFIADKNAQAFCSTACSGGNKRDRSLKYWREYGVLRRIAKKRHDERTK